MTDVRVAERLSQDEFETLCTGTIGALRLDDARALSDLRPLSRLTTLTRVWIDLPFQIDDLTPLSTLTALTEVWYGNGDLGNDRVVAVPDLRWVAPLVRLEKLDLVGTRLIDTDLAPLLELPRLRELGLPLRRAYRKAVFEYAARSAAFEALAAKYVALDAFVAKTR
jgi:hypothetical protein